MDLVSSKLDEFLRKLETQSCKSSFKIEDVIRLLDCKGRLAQEVILLGVGKKIFNSDGDLYKHTETPKFSKSYLRRKPQKLDKEKEPKVSESHFSEPKVSESHSSEKSTNITSAAQQAGNYKRLPSEVFYNNKLENNKENKESYNNINNINIARARARSQTHAKEKTDKEKKQELVKQILITPSVRLSETLEKAKVVSMAHTYEQLLRSYKNNSFLGVIKPEYLESDSKTYEEWLRAALQAEQLGVSYETYVKAQFYCFDKWFSRPPKPYELASYKTKCNAMERVKIYEREILIGNISSNTRIIKREIAAPKIPKNQKFLQCDRTLRTMMKNYDATEEEIFKVFGKDDQAFLYFDREWLQGNPTYIRMKSIGLL